MRTKVDVVGRQMKFLGQELMERGSRAGGEYVGRRGNGDGFYHRSHHVPVPVVAACVADFVASSVGSLGLALGDRRGETPGPQASPGTSRLLEEVFVGRSAWNAVLGSLRWLGIAAHQLGPAPWPDSQPFPNFRCLEDLVPSGLLSATSPQSEQRFG